VAYCQVKKITDALTQELIVAAPGSSSRLNWTALNSLAHTKLKLLTGYEGPATAKIAMERGESRSLEPALGVLQAEKPEWLRDRKVNLLLQTGIEKNRTLPDLPRMIDLVKTTRIVASWKSSRHHPWSGARSRRPLVYRARASKNCAMHSSPWSETKSS
jgi:hypothetical protein